MKNYTRGSHSIYHHRYHLVWITKYRYKVLSGKIQERVRDIIAQVSDELGVKIFNGIVLSDHVHIYCSIPPHICVSEYVKRSKGRSSIKLQKEFPDLKKKILGLSFLG